MLKTIGADADLREALRSDVQMLAGEIGERWRLRDFDRGALQSGGDLGRQARWTDEADKIILSSGVTATP